MKQCSKCGETKSKSEFSKHKRCADGVYTVCKACNSLLTKQWKSTNPEKAREASRKYSAKHPDKLKTAEQKYRETHSDTIRDNRYHRLYNISLAEYDIMLASQSNKCKICGADTPGGKCKDRFQVDHCHTTGEVRGLLCFKCNCLLGNAADDPATLAKAITYLNAYVIK